MNLTAWIGSALETRYLPGGRGPQNYDCWGLVCAACAACGLPMPPDPGVGARGPTGARALFDQHLDRGGWQVLDGPADGAVAFVPRFETAVHAGIVLQGRVLHTSRATGPQWLPLGRYPFTDAEFARWVH